MIWAAGGQVDPRYHLIHHGEGILEKIVYAIEGLSVWIGRAFGWCILILTLSVSYEVFVRYVLNAPTVWAFDMMVQMYGALFLMAGPYALAHVPPMGPGSWILH